MASMISGSSQEVWSFISLQSLALTRLWLGWSCLLQTWHWLATWLWFLYISAIRLESSLRVLGCFWAGSSRYCVMCSVFTGWGCPRHNWRWLWSGLSHICPHRLTKGVACGIRHVVKNFHNQFGGLYLLWQQNGHLSFISLIFHFSNCQSLRQILGLAQSLGTRGTNNNWPKTTSQLKINLAHQNRRGTPTVWLEWHHFVILFHCDLMMTMMLTLLVERVLVQMVFHISCAGEQTTAWRKWMMFCVGTNLVAFDISLVVIGFVTPITQNPFSNISSSHL